MPTEVRRVLGQAQGIRAAEQHEKNANQVQDFTLRDRQATFLSEHFMNLRHGPALPKPPVANLDDDLQRETAAAHRQRFRFPRGQQAFPFRLWALRVATPIANADDQVAPTQKDNVLAPQRIGAFQNLTTTWTASVFGPIVAFGNFAIIFCSSHRHTSLALGSRKSPFYLTRGVGWNFAVAEIKHGFAFEGESFSDEPAPDVLLTPGNFAIGGGFKADKFKYYIGPVPEEYVLAPGDLIVTMTDLSKASDTLGYPALVPASHNKRYLHNQRLGKIIICVELQIDKLFLYYLLRTEEYRNEVLASASGSVIKHTSP